MQDQKSLSPFEFLVFKPRSVNDSAIDKTRMALLNEAIPKEKCPVEASSDSENSAESDDELGSFPEISSKKDLSKVLSNVKVPNNPLSAIGDPSEKSLLKITNSPNVGALTELRLRDVGLTQFESSNKLTLARLSNLTILDLSKNYISNLADLKQCASLTYLNISSNNISDISSLQSLLKLVTLKANSNKITNIDPIKSCDRLQKLNVSNNLILNFESTLNTLKTLQKLNYLTVHSNPFVNKTRDSRQKLIENLKLIKLDKEIVNTAKSPNPFHRVTNYRKGPKHDHFDDQMNLKGQILELKNENSELKNELSKFYAILEKLRNERKCN